jgi:Tfp pilus assembly protein PilN
MNLSRRPFVNGRPVARVAALLALLGGLLLLGNLYVYFSYVQGTGEKRAQLAQVEQQKEKERRQIAQLNERIATLDLARQNEQVDFLNEKIAERTFSWSQLFDRLAKLMPADVRLTRLSPHGIVDTEVDRRRRGAPPPRKKATDDRVTLAIGGEAKSDQALLQFVDNLFADPAFIDPNLTQQTKEGGKDVIKFDLRVDYLPRGTSRPVISETIEKSEKWVTRGTTETRKSRASARITDAPVHPGRRSLAPSGAARGTGVTPGSPGSPAAVPPGVGVPGVGVPGVGVPPPSPGSSGTPGGGTR